MTPKDEAQPTAREILDAIFRWYEVLSALLGRMELDIASMKSDVAVMKSDVTEIRRLLQR